MRESTESKIVAAKNALTAGLRALVTSDDWTAILRAMAQRGRLSVGRLSFGNQILCMVQAPGAGMVATYPTWQRAGRQVRAGEKAIWIIAPRPFKATVQRNNDEPEEITGLRFKALPVFALEQTDGEPIPACPVPDVTAPEIFEGSVERLRAVALALDGAPVSDVVLRERQPDDRPSHGWYEHGTRRIVVLTDRPRAHQFHVLVHEIAHALLHGGEDHHAAPVREVEAESVSYVVCHALGLPCEGFAFPYVANWARGTAGGKEDPAAAVLRSGERIAKAAGRILEALGVGVEEEEGRAAA